MAYATEDNLTELVLERWKAIPDPRLREIVTSLVQHLHSFVRDIQPTQEEFLVAVRFLAQTGQMCSSKRQEFILLADVLGVEMLVDAINNRLSNGATPTTIEGPFRVRDSPELESGASMAMNSPGTACILTGTVRSTGGSAIEGATLELWQTDGEGLYEGQRGDVNGPWMRGSYKSGPDGSYMVRTVLPIAYSIPMDGPVGRLVDAAGISHMRPAHIHCALIATGHKTIVTHLFQQGDRHLATDAVFAVKEPLIVHFEEQPAGQAPNGEIMTAPYYYVRHDFVLQPEA